MFPKKKKKKGKPDSRKRRKGREDTEHEVVSIEEVFAEHTPQSPDELPGRAPRGRAAVLHPEDDAWSAP